MKTERINTGVTLTYIWTVHESSALNLQKTSQNTPFDEAIDMWSLGLTVVVAALRTDFIPPLNNNYDILNHQNDGPATRPCPRQW